MNTFLALNNSITMAKQALEKILSNIARDQLNLEEYKQRENANTLLIDARQASINLYYDNTEIISELLEILPGLIDQRIAEARHKLEQAHSLAIEAVRNNCPVCNPPSKYYPYYSDEEKERARALSISELQKTMPKLF